MPQPSSSRPRFRLRTLLLWVTFAAVASATIATANGWLLLALKVLVIAFCGANIAMGIVGKNGDRVFHLAAGIVGVLLLRFIPGGGAIELTGWEPTKLLLHNAASNVRSWLDGNHRPVILDASAATVYAEYQMKARLGTSTALVLTVIPWVALAAGYFCRWVLVSGQDE